MYWGLNPAPLKNTTHLFLAKPPLNQQIVQTPLLGNLPPLYWFFMNPP